MIQRGPVHDFTELSGHAMMLSCSQHSYIAESPGNPDMPYPHEMPNIPMQDLDIMVDSKATIDMSGEVNPFALKWGPKCRFIWRVEQLLIFYGATVATCSVSRAGLLSHAKPI